MEVLESSTLRVEMTVLRPRSDEDAALDMPVVRLFRMRFPPGLVLAVEQRLKLACRIRFRDDRRRGGFFRQGRSVRGWRGWLAHHRRGGACGQAAGATRRTVQFLDLDLAELDEGLGILLL